MQDYLKMSVKTTDCAGHADIFKAPNKIAINWRQGTKMWCGIRSWLHYIAGSAAIIEAGQEITVPP
jgi:hypothetical protein